MRPAILRTATLRPVLRPAALRGPAAARSATVVRTLLVSSLGLLSTGAWAKSGPKVVELEMGELQLTSTVEVPLYDVPGFEMVPVVAAQVGETRLFLALLPGIDEVGLTGPGAAALGLEGDEADGGYSVAEVDSLQIGALTLSNLEVATASPVSIPRWAGGASIGRTQVLELDGYIGLDALPSVAWAILPSAGVVRFAPEAEGDALVSGVGAAAPLAEGAPASVYNPATVVKKGKTKTLLESSTVVAATFGSANTRASLKFQDLHSRVAPSVVGDITPARTVGGYRVAPAKAGLGDQVVDTVVIVDGGPDVWDSVELDDAQIVKAYLGRDVLGRYDLARNNASGAFAAALVKESKRQDPVPLMLADAEQALKKAMEAPTDAEEEVQKDTTLPKGSASAWTAVAKAREAAGDYPGALEAWQTAAKFEPNGCQGWLDYGARVMDYGTPSDAKESLTKAASLYHSWWDWEPEVREALSEVLEGAAEAGQDYFFQPADIGFVEVDDIRERDVAMGAPAPALPETGALVTKQPDSCDTADGYLARLALLEGDFEAVESLYRDTFDLDTYVADIQGVAAVLKGEPAEAHEALRQAILREWHTGPNAVRRAALAQAYIAQGDREMADKLLSRGLELRSLPFLHDQWLANSLELRTPVETTRLAKARSDSSPNDAYAHLTWLQLAQQAGRAAQEKEAAARVEQALAFQKLHFKNRADTWVASARYELSRGELTLAARQAKRATMLAPQLGAAWSISADVAEAQGDTAAATAHRKRAAQASSTVVPYAKAVADAK